MTSIKLEELLRDKDGVYLHSIYAKTIIAQLKLLEALEAGGVDNWEWYHESTRHLY